MKRTTVSERALVLAPRGRDAALAITMLGEAEIAAHPCRSLPDLIDELNLGAALVVVTEEALATADLGPIAAWIADQQEWSDLPFVLLTSHGGGLARNPAARRYLDVLGNATFVERPFHPTTLVSLARAALRGRRRQYEARSRLEALRQGELALRGLNETLERRVAEEVAERAKAEEALRQAQKMEAIGQLTGGVAHDFNNLLAGISGSLELMQVRISQGRLLDLEKYMVAAQGAAKRAAALTHRLLAFSRRQTLMPKATNVDELIAGMLDLIQRTVGPSVHVQHVGVAGLWSALVDPSQLENALLNLCINARDAMPGGGKITIETANKWIDRRAAESHDLPEGQYLSLCVTDTGTGMTPEVISKAFDPFFTTKPLGQGTGLGLSMIYGFAKQSGGQVRIYSEVGEGTTVCIYLPRHRGKAVGDEAERAPAPVPFGERGETVLIVDDEPTVRMLVTDVLDDLGYTAIEAADGPEGLRVLQADARVDLLITDVGLPGGMNGPQMADAARKTRPDLKVLFITGFAENALLNNGQLEPGMSVLTKPFAVDALAARIREMIVTR